MLHSCKHSIHSIVISVQPIAQSLSHAYKILKAVLILFWSQFLRRLIMRYQGHLHLFFVINGGLLFISSFSIQNINHDLH